MRSAMIRQAAAALAVLAAIVGFSAAYGQRAPADATARTTAAARELLLAMGTEKQFETVIPLVMDQMAMAIARQNPQHETAIREAVASVAAKLAQRRAEVIDQIAVLYAGKFAESEPKDMTGFFRTPAGAKFVALQPELVAQQMAIGQRWGQKLGQEVENETRQELKKRGINL